MNDSTRKALWHWINGPATIDDVLDLLALDANGQETRIAELVSATATRAGEEIAELDAKRAELAEIVDADVVK